MATVDSPTAAEEYDRIMSSVRQLENEHFKTPCNPQRCSHLSHCDCFFMLTGSHATDCPAFSPG